MVKILIKKIQKNISLPEYKTEGSSGMDLLASIDKAITLAPSSTKAMAVALPMPCAAAVTTIFLFLSLILI